MEEETSDAMNLDLNLCPVPVPAAGSITNDPMNLDDWIQEPLRRIGETAVSIRARQRRRWRQVRILPETQNISVDINQFLVNHGNGSGLQTGEGSVAAEERTEVAPKTCDNNNGVTEDRTSEKKDEIEKGTDDDGINFFDCNICLDLSKDPVVTCCGHLFCWSCLYRWLHVHSDAKECPVCKGEVTVKNVTPIYGRGNPVRNPEEDSTLDIPLRPQARRVESLRQAIQRSAFTLPVQEMIRRLGSRIDHALTRDQVQLRVPENARERVERTSSLLNRILTSRGMRREQNVTPPLDDASDITENDIGSAEAGVDRRAQSVLLGRTPSRRTISSSFSNTLDSAERWVEAYLRDHSLGRNQGQPPPVDDRDSFSSIAAVSESQVDSAAEIDSMVSLSTSSSRRRNDTSRVSDVDSGDSRALRRRRLT